MRPWQSFEWSDARSTSPRRVAFYAEVLHWPVTKQWDEPDRGRIFGYEDVARIELIDAAHDGTIIDGPGERGVRQHPGR